MCFLEGGSTRGLYAGGTPYNLSQQSGQLSPRQRTRQVFKILSSPRHLQQHGDGLRPLQVIFCFHCFRKYSLASLSQWSRSHQIRQKSQGTVHEFILAINSHESFKIDQSLLERRGKRKAEKKRQNEKKEKQGKKKNKQSKDSISVMVFHLQLNFAQSQERKCLFLISDVEIIMFISLNAKSHIFSF